MLMKLKSKISVISLLILLFVCVNVSAQTKQKILLKKARGEAGKAVAGKAKATISGDAYRDFTFNLPTSRGVDIGLYPSPEDAPLTFDLIAPDGTVLEKGIGDYLNELDKTGTYTIRVYLLKEDADIKRPAKTSFTVTVFMYI